jgi:hypothetical protein
VTIFIGNITHYHLEKVIRYCVARGPWGKDNGVLLGAWTAALVKIQILPQQIFTMAEARCFKNLFQLGEGRTTGFAAGERFIAANKFIVT